jgi:hypothetical protein
VPPATDNPPLGPSVVGQRRRVGHEVDPSTPVKKVIVVSRSFKITVTSSIYTTDAESAWQRGAK